MTPTPALTRWTKDDVAAIGARAAPVIDRIDTAATARMLPDHYLWDMWPVQLANGAVADIVGGICWMILSSPLCDDPEVRHGLARIRLLYQSAADDSWRDLGNLLPDDLNPGSREWAGSAILDPGRNILTLYFTATGRAGEPTLTYGQRLFETYSKLVIEDDLPTFVNWSRPVECVANCGAHYMLIDETQGTPGTIKAFRDPAWFRDPNNGKDYLLFSASMPGGGDYNGAIGIAVADVGGWRLLPPLMSADGLNNELERPHIVHRAGRYYLFWSTHHFTFAPGGAAGPSGLFGMVASDILGPYVPLNRTGLVAANPTSAPDQAYSWLVLDDLRVASFIDSPSGGTFVGTPAPMFRLMLEDESARIVETVTA
jgi:levansucrase